MNTIAFTGAGISKASGIPTFEEVPGLKDKLSLEFKRKHSQEFKKVLKELEAGIKDKHPNDAHIALSEYNVPIITMNIDLLHDKAGSKKVVELHGNIETGVVLYGDNIRNTFFAESLMNSYKGKPTTFLVIGNSLKTSYGNLLVSLAISNNFKVEYINDNAETKVRKFLEDNL